MRRLIAAATWMSLMSGSALACAVGFTSDCASPIYRGATVGSVGIASAGPVVGVGGLMGGPWTTGTRPPSPQPGIQGFNTSLGVYEAWNGTSWSAPSGSGTVTSVGLLLPSSIFNISGTPVTSSGVLTATLATQGANTFLAGPTSGASAQSSFRVLVGTDLPATAVTPGNYTNVNLTVDQQGRITQAANGTGGSGGSGTVTTVSVASANGFTGTVANPTTTPAITLSTSATGMVKGSGGALVAATPNVDYLPSTWTTSATPSLDVPVVISNSSTANINLLPNVGVLLVGDGVMTRYVATSYSAVPRTTLNNIVIGGTQAAPTITPLAASASWIFTGWNGNATVSSGSMTMAPKNQWVLGTDYSTMITWSGTPSGSTTMATWMTLVDGGLAVGAPTGANEGFGTINATQLFQNGAPLVASAITDTTNAGNITAGTLGAGRLPNPSASTLGGIQSAAGVSHQWISSISLLGVPGLTQPAFADLSGTPTTFTGYGITGGALTAELVTAASTTGSAGLNLPPGTAPTSPVNGDLWLTSAGLFARVAGGTVGPFGIGGGTGCTVGAGAAGLLVTANGSSGCALDGAASVTAGALSLGSTGVPGSVVMGNATSGALTLQPVAGALGAVTVSIPAATDTLVNLAGAQTLTNKVISGAANTLSNIGNGSLTNSSMTIAGHSVALGGTQTLAAADLTNGTTGSGAVVLGTSPTLTTPNIGNATGNITGNAATVTTNANLTGDVTSTGNATTLAASTVTGKALTSFSAGAGTVSAADTILSAFNKVVGNLSALVIGTSGATLPLLNGTNTWSGTQTFGAVIGGVNTQSGIAYTLAATDCGRTVVATNAAAITVTTFQAAVVGCNIVVEQGGAGQITFANGGSATLVSAHSYTKTFNAKGATVNLFVDVNAGAAAEFILSGDGA